jgi:enoyl-CoA hydratase/carnithine racemase
MHHGPALHHVRLVVQKGLPPMPDFEFISYEKAHRIAYLTINRPDVMNALHPPASVEMSQAWDDFAADPEAWVAIVTGAGERAFSAGMDLRYRAQNEGERVAMPDSGFGGLTNPRKRQINKPIIAAVNGYALGGGLELAMACDIIIASDTAQLGLPEAKRGILPGAGGMHRLPRQIPYRIALGYMLTGRNIPADEAYRWGLVNEVVPPADLMDTARKWAQEILECAPLSVRAIKQAASMGLDMSLEEAYNTRFPAQEAMQGSEDSREGPRAFAERRKPVWQGR